MEVLHRTESVSKFAVKRKGTFDFPPRFSHKTLPFLRSTIFTHKSSHLSFCPALSGSVPAVRIRSSLSRNFVISLRDISYASQSFIAFISKIDVKTNSVFYFTAISRSVDDCLRQLKRPIDVPPRPTVIASADLGL